MAEKAWTPDGSLPKKLALAFAPVHKSALGAAAGMTFGVILAAVTLIHVVARPTGGPPLELLGQYFYGYTVSWVGVAVGFFWGTLTGFVAGWFVGFTRNFVLAVWLISVRARAELSNPFLDHI